MLFFAYVRSNNPISLKDRSVNDSNGCFFSLNAAWQDGRGLERWTSALRRAAPDTSRCQTHFSSLNGEKQATDCPLQAFPSIIFAIKI